MSDIDPRAIIKAALVKVQEVPPSSFTPPATPDLPDPQPIVIPAKTVLSPVIASMPDIIKSADGEFYDLNGAVSLIWAMLQSMEIRTVTGHVTVSAIPGGVGGTIWAAGAAFDKLITWDTAAPETPTGVLVSAEAGVLTAGKTIAVVKDGTTTAVGATLTCTNISGGSVVVNASNPITYNAQALYIYTPPLATL
jgi:hypothetical protein